MADLNIDTTDANYQQMVTQGIPWLRQQMLNRKPFLISLVRQGEKAKLQQWLIADPLLADFVVLVEASDKVIRKIRGEIG
jgi:hypothetical protein